MGFRTRLLAFGSAGALVIAGAIARGGARLIGQLLTIVLMSLGFGGAVLLVFLEIGRSEDRERAREDRQRGGADYSAGSGTHGRRCVPGRLDRRVVRTEAAARRL